MQQLGEQARAAAQQLAIASTQQKNQALLATRDYLLAHEAEILAANQQDIDAAKANDLSAALTDRLLLNAERIEAMAVGLQQIASLPDPVGKIDQLTPQPSGITVGKMRVPIGVIGIIYESRPNVTIDAGALCLKSGNAAILRGGKEAFHSNQAIAKALQHGLTEAGLDQHCVQVLADTDRGFVTAMAEAEAYIDAIIPRGGKRLIQAIVEVAKVPVIKHLDGICHVYIDRHATPEIAVNVAFNAKCRRYSPCGAMETLLVDQAVAETILPTLVDRYREQGVELRGCEQTQQLVKDCVAATEEDWSTEYLAPILSIKIVADVAAAITHINHYGSHHTDSIISEYQPHIQQFLTAVDSSSVMVNTSTQFADGFEYGLGAEIGISTNKLHVRGPVGLEGLTIQKYIVTSNGVVRP